MHHTENVSHKELHGRFRGDEHYSLNTPDAIHIQCIRLMAGRADLRSMKSLFRRDFEYSGQDRFARDCFVSCNRPMSLQPIFRRLAYTKLYVHDNCRLVARRLKQCS